MSPDDVDQPLAHPVGSGAAAPPAGWSASLELRFERRGAATRLVSNRHRGPLRLLRALPQSDGSCEAVIVHPPGGLVGGDSLDLDVQVGPSSHLLCTTPGAQKWYRSAQFQARAVTRVSVGSESMLEWLPQPAIVYEGAHVDQTVRFQLAPDARMIGWECLVLGRGGMGERFTRGSLRQRLSLAVDGRLAWIEQTRADAGDRLFASPLGWRGHCVSGTVWAVGPSTGSLLSEWRGILDAFEDRGRQDGAARFEGGASHTTPTLLLARLLAGDAAPVIEASRALWAAARPLVLDRPAALPRIWST